MTSSIRQSLMGRSHGRDRGSIAVATGKEASCSAENMGVEARVEEDEEVEKLWWEAPSEGKCWSPVCCVLGGPPSGPDRTGGGVLGLPVDKGNTTMMRASEATRREDKGIIFGTLCAASRRSGGAIALRDVRKPDNGLPFRQIWFGQN